MSGPILEALERLAAGGFELVPVPELETHYVIARDGFVAMVERRENGCFGSSGNPGKLGARGIALYVERGGRRLFVAKGAEDEATPDEVVRVKAFAADLKQALGH